MNEPSAYYHPGRDLLMVLYTDDQLLDGTRKLVGIVVRACC